ncbi:MAG TPA: acetyl-CoA carboxylase biotin carboxylase subunit [Ktedonobacterales bacterium]|jgi:geranyl-CoA carboxylase alpha subunit|nr:acetyl-CoA carboxylase biotin carboxylase subunit [Ktedonobacterales bacterium]
MIRKVLVANRGEIACRITRTCRAMGIATVAVYSDADVNARHVREADEAVHIGESAASASYLNIPTLITAAKRTGSDAIHPGYGFLAERAEFAAACRDAGITFIGPSPEVIARMGDKSAARRLMSAAGVRVVPGYDDAVQSDNRLMAAAREIGFPLLVKAVAGGGGKGMRIVERERDLQEALAAARREARSAFSDARLLLERLIREPRHIEFQIFGDAQGHIIHLGERECSIQRRHQKVIEETPSVALTPELREKMGEAAVMVGRRLGYTNAGTVEFILAPDGQFYFLEVNTRLQVEHPVTELVTGLDLVRWQIQVAEGHSLPLMQEQVMFNGHAVEARVYAEDPAQGYLPATGTLALWREPHNVGVRVDAGVSTGDVIPIYYDPMVAKISAHGVDRTEAVRRLERALGQTLLFGVRNNIAFLRRVLLHPEFVAGETNTAFLERHAADLEKTSVDEIELSAQEMAALACALQRNVNDESASLAGWRNNRNRPLIERFSPLEISSGSGYSPRNPPVEVQLLPGAGQTFAATTIDGERAHSVSVRVVERKGPDLTLIADGLRLHLTAMETSAGEWWAQLGEGESIVLRWISPLPEPDVRAKSGDSLAAPMPGQVIALLVTEGQAVRAGDPLVILEAMKMEHTIRAPHDGVVAAIHARPGTQVTASAVLLDVRQEATRKP